MRNPLALAGVVLLAIATPAPRAAQSQVASKLDTPADTTYGRITAAEARLENFFVNAPKDSIARARYFEELERASLAAANEYRALAANPSASVGVLGKAVHDFYSGKSRAGGAVQVSQAADEQQIRLSLLRAAQEARIIEQNDRIIQLLEQLAKKK
ncbi:MAG: hypothetical protein M3Z05_15470 [Gemmatimonadota bacterium]|nr:hypothetical protein [Gemmatimonadota bacterium]